MDQTCTKFLVYFDHGQTGTLGFADIVFLAFTIFIPV